MAKKGTLFAALLTLLIGVSVASCDFSGIVPDGGDNATPTITPARRPSGATHRTKITALFCDDSTGSYRRSFFNAGRQTVADSLVNAVQAGQDGITLYVTTINLDTVGPDDSLDPPLQVPPIGDYPSVTVVPYTTVSNTLKQSDANAAVDATNTVGISTYNNQVAAITKQMQDAKNKVTKNEVSRLLSWNPPQDDRGTSVLGCLYLVKSRLQITQGVKQLIIASDLEDNVSTSLTSDFVHSQGLKGVSVHVIELPGTTNDNVKRATWCTFFRNAGAAAIKIDDTVTSATLHNLFNADLDLRTTGCP